jgi:putative transposase
MIEAGRDCFTTSVSEKLQWFKDATWSGELSRTAQESLRHLLQGSLEEEINCQLGIRRPYERVGERDQRNGYYTRRLETQRGPIPDLRVPRSRRGEYRTGVFRRYQRRTAEVDRAICAMFLRGISTREVGAVLEGLTGSAVSASTVSRVCKVLDGLVAEFHRRPLGDAYQYILFDGIWLRCKGAQLGRKVVVLAAYGITVEGRRELIDFHQASSESEANWTRFLQGLYQRGLRGKRLRVVTTDGASGLIAALDLVYPLAPRQRCWVHKLRNVSNKLRARNRPACLAGARAIYLAATRAQAIGAFRQWEKRWGEEEPGAVKCLAQDIEALLVCFEVPVAHRQRIRTTNPLERAFREVRRRTNPMSCFNNPASVERIIFAVMQHQNTNWSHKPLSEFTHNT